MRKYRLIRHRVALHASILAILSLGVVGQAYSRGETSTSALQSEIREAVSKALPASIGIVEYREDKLAPDGEDGFSGVIVSPDGIILTAAHATQPGKRYRIFFADGSEADAEALGNTQILDIAMMKITDESDEGEWPHVEMGWSFNLKKNQPCVSIAHARGVYRKRGPVVRFGRIITPISKNAGYIQNSCLMEPGDSGGPLFDIEGRLIGIRSNIRMGLDKNFDIPIDYFHRYWSSLLEPKSTEPGDLPLEPRFGISMKTGKNHVAVKKVKKGSLAAKAGVKVGDKLLAIDGVKLTSWYQAQIISYGAYVSKEKYFKLKVARGDDEKTLTVSVPPLAEGAKAAVLSEIEPVPELENFNEQFADIEAKWDNKTAIVRSRFNKSNRKILAAIVSVKNNKNTYLVSKASEVGKAPKVKFENGTFQNATVVARDQANDLVLLKTKKKTKSSIYLGSKKGLGTVSTNKLGRLLLSPNPKDEGEASIVASIVYPVPARFGTGGVGVLGVGLGNKKGKTIVLDVRRGSGAHKAGLKRDDIIKKINGASSFPKIFSEVGKHFPGDAVSVVWVRKKKRYSAKIKLGKNRPSDSDDKSGHVADEFEDGASNRRTGFRAVFTHDGRLKPNECGGPVFNMSGKFMGINIARYSRTSSLAIPAPVVAKFVKSSL